MLTNEQAKENLKKYGPNELEEGKKKSVFQIFLEQFKDFLVIILIISAVISGFLGDVESAIVIFVVITMNAILGTVQTVKAEQSKTWSLPVSSFAVASAIASAVPSAATAVLMSVRTTEPVARVPVQSASMVSPFMTALIAYS